MNLTTQIAATLTVAGSLLFSGSATAAEKDKEKDKVEPPKVGDKAPDFKLKGSDGKDYTLKQFAGRKAVVIAWFPKVFTGG